MKKSMWQQLLDGEIVGTTYHDFLAKRKGYKNWNEQRNERLHRNGECKSMSENKECSQYLGIHIAERILNKVFNNTKRMPNNNEGCDFICNEGHKVDVKSACCIKNKKDSTKWLFNIKKNKIPDYFLLLAFNNRKNLEPKHIWLINSYEIIRNRKLNQFLGLVIANSKFGVKQFKQYEVKDKLSKVIKCCNKLKGEK